jgi:hypothetical protein
MDNKTDGVKSNGGNWHQEERPVEAIIEDLHRKCGLLSHAMRGVMNIAEDGAVPVISWDDELTPVYDLVLEVSVLARDLWLRTDEDARRQVEQTAREQGAILQAAAAGAM